MALLVVALTFCMLQGRGALRFMEREALAMRSADSTEVMPAVVVEPVQMTDAEVLTATEAAVAEVIDTVAPVPKKRNFIQRIIDYFGKANKEDYSKPFDFSIIGGPYYSAETKFGIGLVGSGLYRTDRSDTLLPRSSVSLKATISTSLFYSFAIQGQHVFPHQFANINYNFDFSVMPTYFWGVGYTKASDYKNKTKYKDLRFNAYVDAMFRLTDNLYGGPQISGLYGRANSIEDPAYFSGLSTQVTTFGAGLALVYDSRDYITAPFKGWYVKASGLFMPKFAGNVGSSYWKTDLTVSNYFKTWRDCILAWRFASTLTFGNVPWPMMPTFGTTSMRGYYMGQYRDKCSADVCVEFRQRIWRRIGCVVWLGAGTVFSDFSHLKDTRILPNAGVGFRWEFKKRVNVRLDVGFGKNTFGFEFNINEAF